MTVTLRPITKENWEPVYWLSETLTAEQRSFVFDNGYSMLEAIYKAEKLTAYAIYEDETPVGFVMIGSDDAQDDRQWVVRLMTGGKHQGKGYGRVALKLIIDHFKSVPNCPALYIGFHPDNRVARQFYESLGFVDTGKIKEEEMVFRLPLTES